MRKTILILAAAVAAILLTAAFSESQAQAPAAKASPAVAGLRIGVCDTAQVIRKYKRIENLNGELAKKQNGLRDDEEKKVKALDARQAELANLKEGSPEYDKRLDELLTQRNELKAWRETQDLILRKWHYNKTREMFQEVLRAVQDTAGEKGFLLVLFKEPEDLSAPSTAEMVEQMIRNRKVLYSDPAMDVTDAVIARLNFNYKAPASSPAAP